jgi:hypothetical protein
VTATLRPFQGFSIVFVFIAGLASFGLAGTVQANPRLFWSFVGAASFLLAWSAGLFCSARRRSHPLTLEFIARPQHYLQSFLQLAIFTYWGWYWRVVYESFYLIAAQVLFAYAFDWLLSWSRRDSYKLTFLPFPIVFSVNLFLWFKPDWFYFQFMMLAVAFLAKELIRWNKDGRETHIFNPSAFALMLFSVALLLTGTTDLTWGKEIAITQFYPPQMYLFIFLIGLPAQYLFGVTTMTMSAVLTTYLFGLAYYSATGTYFFFDSYIPISVFFGMHLLFTDPSTAPRTELGRMIYGALYGLGNIAAYQLLQSAGAPEFYDKLLPVPILNSLIQVIDRIAKASSLRWLDPSTVARSLIGSQRNLGYIAVWTLVFVTMSAVQGVGDEHPGQFVPFWQQACRADRLYACNYLNGLYTNFCRQGSTWACNELDLLQARDGAAQRALPTLDDYPIILRGSKAPITNVVPAALYTRACTQGWSEACAQTLNVGRIPSSN